MSREIKEGIVVLVVVVLAIVTIILSIALPINIAAKINAEKEIKLKELEIYGEYKTEEK